MQKIERSREEEVMTKASHRAVFRVLSRQGGLHRDTIRVLSRRGGLHRDTIFEGMLLECWMRDKSLYPKP